MGLNCYQNGQDRNICQHWQTRMDLFLNPSVPWERVLHRPHCFLKFALLAEEYFLKAVINLVSPSPMDKRKHISSENNQKLCPSDSTNKGHFSLHRAHENNAPENSSNAIMLVWLPLPRTYANHPSVSWALTFHLLTFTGIMGIHAGSWYISWTERGDRQDQFWRYEWAGPLNSGVSAIKKSQELCNDLLFCKG